MKTERDSTTNARSRRVPLMASGPLRHIVLACILLFASLLLAPSQAEAHGLHAAGAVAEATDDTGTGDADMASDAECGTFCCSSATCASALLSLSGHAHSLTTLAARYALPADVSAEARPQTALKRPPRS